MGKVIGPKDEHIQVIGRASTELTADEKRHVAWCSRCKRDVVRPILAGMEEMRRQAVEKGASPFLLGVMDELRGRMAEQLEILAPGFQEEETDE
jgi:hypothetical protein